jgi:hypothetical protein
MEAVHLKYFSNHCEYVNPKGLLSNGNTLIPDEYVEVMEPITAKELAL